MPEVAFSGVANGTDLQGTLFQGKKFWLSQKVPQRSRFIEDVKVVQRGRGVLKYVTILTKCRPTEEKYFRWRNTPTLRLWITQGRNHCQERALLLRELTINSVLIIL